MDAARVLVVEHEADAPAAWLGEGLTAAGVELLVSRPYDGQPLPGDLAGVDGLLVLGGAMDSWDDAGTPWLPQTRALVRAAVDEEVPVLGVCLGHQLVAAALGGEVGRNPAGQTIGLLPLCWHPLGSADPLLGTLHDTAWAVHWNRDVVLAPPPGAEVLARSPDGAVQAARMARTAWGVQFHPEAGADLVAEWFTTDDPDAGTDRVRTDAFLADLRRLEPELEDAGGRLARSFAGLVAGGVR